MRQDEAAARAAITEPTPDGLVEYEVALRLRGEQGCNACISLSVVRDGAASGRLPVIVWLHATGASAATMRPRLATYAGLGFLAIAMDCRYHGRRAAAGADCRQTYQEAIFRAWQHGHECPFILDNVRDLRVVLDYLGTRPDVDGMRIGMAGVSLGGMHTWLCAALDERVAAAAPMIGVQSFKWALDNEHFQGRVDSLRVAFELISAACGKVRADAEVVRGAWERLLPGLLGGYDSPQSLPCIAPRPLLVVNGEQDPRCPVAGLAAPFAACRDAYALFGASAAFATHIEAGAGHEVTREMDAAVEAFFVRHLGRM